MLQAQSLKCIRTRKVLLVLHHKRLSTILWPACTQSRWDRISGGQLLRDMNGLAFSYRCSRERGDVRVLRASVIIGGNGRLWILLKYHRLLWGLIHLKILNTIIFISIMQWVSALGMKEQEFIITMARRKAAQWSMLLGKSILICGFQKKVCKRRNF